MISLDFRARTVLLTPPAEYLSSLASRPRCLCSKSGHSGICWIFWLQPGRRETGAEIKRIGEIQYDGKEAATRPPSFAQSVWSFERGTRQTQDRTPFQAERVDGSSRFSSPLGDEEVEYDAFSV